VPTPDYKEHARALGRGFGVIKPQILEAIGWGAFYGGHESLNLADRVAGDVLDGWPA